MTPPTYPSFAAFYQTSNYTQFPHEQRIGGSFPIHLTRAKQTAVDFVDPPVPELLLVIGLQANIPFKWDIGDGWTKEQRYRAQDLVFCPANTEIRHDCGGDHEVLFCSFSARTIASLLDEEVGLDCSVFNPLHGPVFQDEIIQSAALRMWTESARSDPASNLMIDGLFQTLVAQLLRRANAALPKQSEQLSPAVLARVRDFVEAYCDGDLRIADLAHIAGCSPFYFARSFKQTMGQSPYQYILARRVARACKMLATDHRLAAEIALECGFHDQAHLTRVFKKHLGITPGKYRREHCQ